MDEFLKNRSVPKYLHTILKMLLCIFAIFPEDYKSFRSVYHKVQIFTMGGVLAGSLIPLRMATESVVKLEIFSSVIPQLANLFMFLYFSSQEKGFSKILHRFTSKNADNELQRTNDFFKSNFDTYFILHTAWASLFIVQTYVYLFTQQEFSHKYSLMIPFWLSCEVRQGDYLCWRIDSSLELWLANIITSIAVAIEYIIYCAACILYSVFMANVWIHMETLKTSIRSLAALMKSQRRATLKKCGKLDEYDDAVIRKFYENIKNQQEMRAYCNETIQVMQGYITIFLLEFWSAVVFLTFTSILEFKHDRLLLVKTAIVSISAIIGFITQCIYAQVMTDWNEMILREMSDIPWYEQSIRFRKNYLMCLIHNQRSIQVTASGLFILNYEFSMTCSKTMYSFLNVMLLHYRRKGVI